MREMRVEESLRCNLSVVLSGTLRLDIGDVVVGRKGNIMVMVSPAFFLYNREERSFMAYILLIVIAYRTAIKMCCIVVS